MFKWAIALMCLMFRSLLPPVYTSFLTVHYRPLEYRLISSDLILHARVTQ